MNQKHVPKSDFFKDLDVMPQQEYLLEKVRLIAKKIGAFYGFQKISTSVVEEYKRISSLVREGFFNAHPPLAAKTKDGIEIILRSSGIVSVLRMYGDHGMGELPQPVKLNFEGESFSVNSDGGIIGRYEMGFIMAGEAGPIAEAELFQVMRKTLEELGVRPEEVLLRFNAIGCMSCQSSFRSALAGYFRSRVNRLCKHSKREVKRMPTRILVCTEEKCVVAAMHAPQVLDYLCESCKKHLRGVLEFLDEMGAPYFLDHTFFREGSWYSQLIFQLTYGTDRKKEKNPRAEESLIEVSQETKEGETMHPIVIAEGGRVSALAETIIGRRVDASAAVFFLSEVAHMLTLRQSPLTIMSMPKVFLVHLGELAKRKSIAMIEVLRSAGIGVAEILGKDSIKTQLNTAEKTGVRFALILGQKEALDETVIVREIDSGVQETIPQGKLIDFLKKKFEK